LAIPAPLLSNPSEFCRHSADETPFDLTRVDDGPRAAARNAAAAATARAPAAAGACRGSCDRGCDRLHRALGEGIQVPRGDAGIPTRASLPFNRQDQRRLPRLPERSHRAARLRRFRRSLEPSAGLAAANPSGFTSRSLSLDIMTTLGVTGVTTPTERLMMGRRRLPLLPAPLRLGHRHVNFAAATVGADQPSASIRA
jgi:hypothetical protein